MARFSTKFALRRQEPTQNYKWWPVRAQRVLLENARSLPLFSYRHGPLVHIFEESTGVDVAFGPSLLYARREANQIVAESGVQKVLESCQELNKKLGVGIKPRLKK